MTTHAGMTPGVFYGVGVGPGDPDLMTLKSVRVLEGVPVIAVPSSSGSKTGSVALSIVSGVVDTGGKEVLELRFPMTRDKAALRESRDKAADMIAGRLSEGLDVAFITLGDPMLYSTFSYLVPLVREKVAGVEVASVAGVTAMSAAASRLCAPLAEADEKVIIIPAAYDMEEVRRALDSSDTVVLMKVNRKIDELVDLISGIGLAGKAVFTSRVGFQGDEFTTEDIRALKGKSIDYFSLIIVRKNSGRI